MASVTSPYVSSTTRVQQTTQN